MPAHAFVHPGGLHTESDFLRMSNKVAQAAHPWVDSYNQLTTVWMANLNMPWAPVTQIIRGTTGNNYARSQKDALAIYYHALRWRITGNTNYAEEAIVGMNLWSATMTNGVGGDSNWALGAGLCGYEFAIAGEALRGYPNWSQTSISNYCNFLKIFAGGNEAFLNNHNGTCDSHYWCNWDACNVASLIACAVFCDDTNMFNRAVTYLKQGKGNGNLASAAWFIHTNGLAQWQESGRDQAHTMDGVAWLGVACEVAWNQGVDLYGFDNNRLLRGVEYACKYNLGQDVPYQTFSVCEGASFNWGTLYLSSNARGFLAPTWDLFYNHYVNRLGLSAPFTAQAAAVMRPDGFYSNVNSPDFVGFTTLTHLLDPIPAGAMPGGLTARIYGTNTLLNWWGSAYATNYLVKRATVPGGPYTTIASIPATNDRAFFDSAVSNGCAYYYVVSAQDKFGESANSPETKICFNQLTAYYRFNESSGLAADASGLCPSATLVNGASFTATGKFSNGVSLNGSSQYVALPSGLIADLGDFTIAAWVYLNTQNSWARLFDFGADTDRYMFLAPYNGSGMRFAISKFTGPGEQQISAPALTAGAWHHVAVTLKRGNGSGVGTLYVDGAATGSNSSMTFTPDMIGSLVNATNNYIGRSQFADPYLNGRVDDFRIYNGALSGADIAALFALNPVAPAAPASVTAMAISANAINLAWTAGAGATNYLIQRSTNSGGPYVPLAASIASTNYTDSGLTGNTTYYYVIVAVNHGGTSANSPQASATTLTPPPAPMALKSTGLFGGQIALSWNASTGATSYTIKRSMLSGGPYITLAGSVSSTNFTDTGLFIGATYYYVVSAVNPNGESVNSNETNAVVPVPTLNWKGSINTNWDVNLTTNWLFSGLPSTYFTDAAVIFDDTATNPNVNLTASVAPYSVTFSNSALNYTIGSTNGSGISGTTAITKSGTGTVTLTGPNIFTGDLKINGSGAFIIGGNGVLGGGDYPGNIANYGTFNYASTATQTLSGALSLSGSLLKTGSGTLTVSGLDTHTGPTVIRQGTLNLAGQPKSNSGFVYGIYAPDNNAASTTNALLNISTDVTTYELWLGDRAGSGQVGAAYQSVGDMVLTRGASVNDLRIGSVASGRGYYKLSGGSLTVNEAGIGSDQNSTIGIMEITGGTFTDNGWLAIARGGATSSGLLNITGGSASAARVDMNWSGTSGALAVINVGGENFPASLTAAASATLGVNLAEGSTTAGTLSIVNLRTNGTLTAGRVRAWQPNPNTTLNFDGGTLQANIDAGNFLTDANVDNVFVHAKGGTIDNGNKAITVDRPLLAPTGVGVNAITGPSVSGSGYVAAPFVTITGGTFTAPATAYAVMVDDGTGKGTFKVSSIVVASRGVYSVAPTTVTLTGGGSATASGFSISTTANTSGGMTFSGAGVTTLSGANTYTGATVIASGTVRQGGALLHLTFDQTNGATVVNAGSGGSAMDGTLTGTNANIVSGGRFGNALQIGSGAATTGYVLVNNPVVALNGQPGNSWAIAMWLKSTTAGGVYFYQGDGGWGSGNTEFYLKDATQTSAAGTRAGGVRWGQAFVAGTTNLSDGNWHFVVMSVSNGLKTLYCDGAVDPISSGASSWAGNGIGSQVRIGGAGAGADSQTGLNGLIDDVFVYGRALSLADVTNLLNGIEAPAPAIPAGTDLTVATGASLVLISSAQSVGALNGGSSGIFQLGAGATPTALTFGGSMNSTFAGNLAGSGSITKVGTGSVTLSGSNSYNGSTTISQGTLTFAQATLPTNGTVNIASGAVLNLDFVGTNRVGALVLNGASQLPGDFNVANSSPFITGAGSLMIPNSTAMNPTNLVWSVSGSNLMLSWPASHIGWRLQVQTNALAAGFGTNWANVAGASQTNTMVIPLVTSLGSIFYRLIYP